MAAKKKTKKSNRVLQGRYLGLMRHAKRTVKSGAKKLYAKKGPRAAVAYLRKRSK